ncbi:MAG: hypothetical protein V7K27_05225 [Nostoc sp.]|uniref:hypothetical protein n=1 Tax=Nostoc sp. TaxID=1180 RepID=UPI002FF6A4BE
MAGILELLKVTAPALTDPVVAATTYYFLGSPGVYVTDVATATGISQADAKLNGVVPRVAVKELLLAGVLHTVEIEITTGSGATTKTYRKQLRYAETVTATVKENLIGKTWPLQIAKVAGGKIIRDLDPRRVISRK